MQHRLLISSTVLAFAAFCSAARAQTVNILHDINSTTEGSVEYSGLIQGQDGALYGTSAEGGANGFGSIYRVTTTGTLTVLHAFSGTDGAEPFGQLAQAADGSFYGTTNSGGANNLGVVYRLVIPATGTPALTIVHTFTGADGSNPYAGVTLDTNGDIYGVTGGGGVYGWGTLFVIPSGGTFTTLRHFSSVATDGGFPFSRLDLPANGLIYGITRKGGGCNCGALFLMAKDGSGFQVEGLTEATGWFPYSDLTLNADGYYYGSGINGGTYGEGAVFRVSPSSPEAEVVFNMPQYSAFLPFDSGTVAGDSNRYLTSYTDEQAGDGKILQVAPDGTGNIIYTFWGYNGQNPTGRMVLAKDGNLYGVTTGGGSGNGGVVFQLIP